MRALMQNIQSILSGLIRNGYQGNGQHDFNDKHWVLL